MGMADMRRARPAGWCAAAIAIAIVLAGCGAGLKATPGPHSSASGSARSKSASPSGGGSRSGTASSRSAGKSSADGTRSQLPQGGKKIFPRYQVVTYYGTAGTSRLGVLGSRPPGKIADRIQNAADSFDRSGRRVQPAMELIVTVADSHPGPDHQYRHNIKMRQAQRYLKAARAHHMLLILDIQPGHGKFLPLVKHWSKLLAEPDVGLALDSEWHMPDGNTPGKVIGHSNPGDINAASAWLARLVDRRRLPQKLFVLHQFTKPMLRRPSDIKTHSQLATVQHLDGFGQRSDKLTKYRNLKRPKQFHMGFKLFYQQDIDMMSPNRVLNLKPTPEYISYQ